MGTIGHWVVADAGGVGTTITGRAGGLVASFSAGATWSTVGGKIAVRCPAADFIETPDRDEWDPSDFTMFFRGATAALAGNLGFFSHNEGPGVIPKWVLYYNTGGTTLEFHWQTAFQTVVSAPVSLTVDTIYVFAARKSGTTYTLNVYDSAGTLLVSTPTVNANTFPTPAAATLQWGWGGEATFDGDIYVCANRLDDNALSDGDMASIARTEDLSGIPPAIRLHPGMTQSQVVGRRYV